MKNSIFVLVVFLMISHSSQAQFDSFQLFEIEDQTNMLEQSLLLKLNDNSLMMFYARQGALLSKRSTDNGLNWSSENEVPTIYGIYYSFYHSSVEYNAELGGLVLNSGRILLFYRGIRLNVLYSDDNGSTWIEDNNYLAGNFFTSKEYINGAISQINNGDIYFTSTRYDTQELTIIKSTDDGQTWDRNLPGISLESNSLNSFSYISQISDSSLSIIYLDEINDEYNFFGRTSMDSGATWSERELLFNLDFKADDVKFAKNSDGKLTICLENKISVFAPTNYIHTYNRDYPYIADIFYIESIDFQNWTPLSRLTNYPGYDGKVSLSSNGTKTFVSFSSDRENQLTNNRIWFGEIGVSQDTSYDPLIYSTRYRLQNPNSILIEASVFDDVIIDSVFLNFSINEEEETIAQIFDDGQNGDSLANDFIYTYRIDNLVTFDKIEYYISAIDNDSNISVTPNSIFYMPWEDPKIAEVIDVNNIWLPFNNSGVLADVQIEDNHYGGAFYNDKYFLFSSGFFLTGYNNSLLWGNGVHTTDRLEDYQPGKVGTDPNDLNNIIFAVRASDPPFGNSWQQWKIAVANGAEYYDGNGDGLYDPVDLNNNGFWDFNEDRPDLQGDLTAWCVYNDGSPKSQRIFVVDPQGIEIRQTLYASNGNGTNYDDIIFLRYKITNTGSVNERFDSVYFSAAADPDIGDYTDDLAGSDTVHQSGYAFNYSEDNEYGINPPAFFIKQLQGPPVFIPNETYIDNSGNGEFDAGLDTPLDSAVAKHGRYFGESFIPGAKNLGIASYTAYHGIPYFNHPFSEQELRYWQLGGINGNGEPLDPCTWEFGNGASLPNCNEINPKFMYSGDPVSNNGWITIAPNDQIFILSTGPFQLKAGEPVELIYAYIVGRGTDHLNSITVAREISQFAQQVYDNNFEDLPTGIDDDENLIADEFMLYQNYPNPFNPTTTIKYQIPSKVKGQMANVKIIVFDILGREVQTLINEQKPAGTYEIQFDASKLSSGVYFYQLKYGDFLNTKKMVLLK